MSQTSFTPIDHTFTPIDHTFTTTDFAVVAALLDYYGLPYSQRSLNDYLHHHTFGTLMTEIADCLLQHGMDTTLINANPELFSRTDWKRLFLLDYPKTNPTQMPSMNEVERIIAKGVMLRQALPSSRMLGLELKHERPIIITYNPKLIEPLRTITMTHGILTREEGDKYELFEPDYDNLIQLRDKKVVIMAMLAVKSADPSANSVIFTKVHTPAPKLPPGSLPEI